MIRIMSMSKFVLLLVLFFSIVKVEAACTVVPVDLQDRVNESSLVVEGKVVRQFSYWDEAQNNIYTSNIVEVYKVFKGTLQAEEVEVVTEGGVVDDILQVVTNTLRLTKGDEGVFILKPVSDRLQSGRQRSIVYTAVAATQGFVKYDVVSGEASGVFDTYDHIASGLYPEMERLTGQRMRVIDAAYQPSVSREQTNQKQAAHAITSFSPQTINAGTGEPLTIRGTGFGNTRGNSRVGFANANSSNAYTMMQEASQYVSWSDTEIVVYLPEYAGTGKIHVEVDSIRQTSATSLTVPYAVQSIISSGILRKVFLSGVNDSKGYLFLFNENMSTPAKEAFQRALTTWRCNSSVNFEISSATTTLGVGGRDNKNIVSFDDDEPLPSGVLGRTSLFFSGCGGNWSVIELDLIFSTRYTWNFTTNTTFSGSDFESVSLHELGHAHCLNHVIDGTDVMHYAIASGNHRRTLNSNNLKAAKYIMDYSTTESVCSRATMKAVSAATCSATDTYSPDILTLSPANNQTSVALDAKLVLTFTEDIVKGTGNITVKTSAGATHATIPVTGSNVTISGNVMTVKIPSKLSSNTNYYVLVDNTAVKDKAGNLFKGYTKTTDWRFKTETATGINDRERLMTDLDVAPNPSEGTFTLRYNPALRGMNCRIYNSVGQLLYEEQNISNNRQFTIDQPTGLYLIHISNDEGVYGTTKVFIK